MSGQPDNTMTVHEEDGWRSDVGRPVRIRVSAGNGDAGERPPVGFQAC